MSNVPSAWTAAEIKRVGYHVIDLIAEYLSTLADGSVFRPVPMSLTEKFLLSLAPVRGTDSDRILAEFRETVAPYPFGNGHLRFQGWVNSPPIVIGILVEALAAAMNPSCAGGNHAAIYVARQVLNWFKEMLGFPSVALDPHRWLSIPVEAGLVLLKDAQAMRDAFSLVPPYLRTDGNLAGVGGLPWFSECGFQLLYDGSGCLA